MSLSLISLICLYISFICSSRSRYFELISSILSLSSRYLDLFCLGATLIVLFLVTLNDRRIKMMAMLASIATLVVVIIPP